MKKTNFIRHFFIWLVLIVFIASFAGTMRRESTGVYIDDTVINTKVKAEIFNDPMLKVLQINLESFKGVVLLSGFVDSAETSARAVQIAYSVKDVTVVKTTLL